MLRRAMVSTLLALVLTAHDYLAAAQSAPTMTEICDLKNPLTLKRIERSALVPYSAPQMFELINDIASYPKFMPGCTGAEILNAGENWINARLDLSGAGIKQSFVTKNILLPPDSMSMSLVEGPFAALSGQWRFKTLGGRGCRVSLWLEFEMSNKVLGFAMSKVFENIASQQVDAVCRRAKSLYN